MRPGRVLILILAVGIVLSARSTGRAGAIEILHGGKEIQGVLPIQLSRGGRLLTGFVSASSRPLLHYAPGEGAREESPPAGQRFLIHALSDWGYAVLTDEIGSTPMRILAAQHGGPLGEVKVGTANGTFSLPAINDSGMIAFSSRDSNMYGLRDAYRWLPGGEPALLPDLEEDSLGFPAVDGAGRIVLLHEFASEGRPRRVYRHDVSTGWEKLLDTMGPPADPERIFYSIEGNPRGDFLFTTLTGKTVPEFRTWLNLYESASGAITRITEVSGAEPLATRIVEAHVDDGGDVLVGLQGKTESDPPEAFLRRRGEGLVSLMGLLPAGLSLPRNPGIDLTFDGKVLLETVDRSGSKFSYHVVSKKGLESILEDQPARVLYPKLAAGGTLYFWLPSGGGFALARVEPPGVPRLPGDFDGSGSLALEDPLTFLEFLFSRTDIPLPCGSREAGLRIIDVNGDGRIDIADPVHLLLHLFQAGPPPREGTGCIEVRDCAAGPACPG